MYKEIQSGAVAKSYMRKGFLIYEEMRKYFPIYEEAVSHIWLCSCSILNFLIYEEILFSFLSVHPSPQLITTIISLIASLSTFPLLFYTYAFLLQSVFGLILTVVFTSIPLGSIALQTKSITDRTRGSLIIWPATKKIHRWWRTKQRKNIPEFIIFSADGNSQSWGRGVRAESSKWFIEGPGFLAVLWFDSSPPPLPPFSRQQVVSLSQSSCVLSAVELTEGGEERGRGAKSYDRGKSLALNKSFNTLWARVFLYLC